MGLSRETALVIATPPEGVDRSMWLYELCRLLVIEANSLIVAFFNEDPPCSSATCHEMRASEWQYLCAVHDPPKSCCAIDYCCHTLDWAANVLTSQTSFPSRLTLGSGATGGPQQGLRQLTNIFRRVYRIFAHAWFQHRASFWDVEGKKGLYILFKTVCDAYSLIPEENYTIPPEAEGIVTSSEEEKESRSILKKAEDESPGVEHPESTTTISNGATTRRHKHTPSTGSSVTTIAEGDEDDNHPSSPKKEKEPPTEDPISSPLPRTNTQIHSPTPAEPPASPEKKSQASEAPEKPVQEPSLPNLTIADVDADSGETKPSVDNPAEVEEEAPQPTIEESHEEKEAKPNSDPKSEPLP